MRACRQSLPRLSRTSLSSLQWRGWAPSSSSRSGGCRAASSQSGATARDDSQHGSHALANVVRELRAKGKLPKGDIGTRAETERPAWTSEGFADIDGELAFGVEEELVDEEGDQLDEDAPHEFGGHPSRGHLDAFVDAGEEGPDGRPDEELRLASQGAQTFEDVSHLSEEELRERVRRSIEDLVPGETAERVGGGGRQAPQDLAGLTPAQVFYMENRDRLVSRAQDYYLEKQKEFKAMQESEAGVEVEEEWRYYHEPVVRPPKGHLWSTGEEAEGETHGSEDAWRYLVSTWPEGVMPTAEMLADLLRKEQAKDVVIVDYDQCGRRDLGTHAIIATGVTPQHCRRLGDIASKATENCKVRHINAFCWGTRRDEWVVAHCGPIKVHVFTRDTREEYKMQLLWENPEEFFMPEDFPHYLEIYGSGAEANFMPGGHITTPIGARSTSFLPPVHRDEAFERLQRPDYDAAEDAAFVTPAGPAGFIDAAGTFVDAAAPAGETTSRRGGGVGAAAAATAHRAPAGLSKGEESDTDEDVDGDDPWAEQGSESDTDEEEEAPPRKRGAAARPPRSPALAGRSGSASGEATAAARQRADGSSADLAPPPGGERRSADRPPRSGPGAEGAEVAKGAGEVEEREPLGKL